MVICAEARGASLRTISRRAAGSLFPDAKGQGRASAENTPSDARASVMQHVTQLSIF